MKDWKDFPWAKFRAQDKSGAVFYYENKPKLNTELGMWVAIDGKAALATESWMYTLEEKPNDE